MVFLAGDGTALGTYWWWVLFFCMKLSCFSRRFYDENGNPPKAYGRWKPDASKGYLGLYRMQAAELQYHKEQADPSRQDGNEKVLPVLPEAHLT